MEWDCGVVGMDGTSEEVHCCMIGWGRWVIGVARED
jgi:hypothetical protein